MSYRRMLVLSDQSFSIASIIAVISNKKVVKYPKCHTTLGHRVIIAVLKLHRNYFEHKLRLLRLRLFMGLFGEVDIVFVMK